MDETCEPDTKLLQAVCYPAPTVGNPAPFTGSRYAPSPTVGDSCGARAGVRCGVMPADRDRPAIRAAIP